MEKKAQHKFSLFWYKNVNLTECSFTKTLWQSFTESKLIDKNVSDFGTIEQFILFYFSIWSFCENVVDDETLGFGIIEYFMYLYFII